jgi:predicted PurR-regulated permease PerM
MDLPKDDQEAESPQTLTVKRFERLASLVAIGLVIIGCVVVLLPFVSALLWATVLCYCTWPLFLRLERLLGRRRTLAAVVMTFLISVVVVVPFVFAGITLAENVARIGSLFRSLRDVAPAEAPAWIRKLPLIGAQAADYWGDLLSNADQLSDTARQIAIRVGGWLLRHSLDLAKGVGQLALSALIAFFFYRDGERMVARVVTGGRRIAGDSTQRYLAVIDRTVKGVVYGIIGTAFAQGIAGTLGFWIAGVPSPFMFGLLTFFLALVPAGPPLVWVPVTIWIFSQGRIGWGVFMTLWGLFVISGIDNLVRPYLMSRGTQQPFINVLLGAIGGVLAFGFIGIFIGPTLLAVGYCLVQEFSAKPPPADAGNPAGGPPAATKPRAATDGPAGARNG